MDHTAKSERERPETLIEQNTVAGMTKGGHSNALIFKSKDRLKDIQRGKKVEQIINSHRKLELAHPFINISRSRFKLIV